MTVTAERIQGSTPALSRAAFLSSAVASAGVLGVVYANDPTKESIFPVCPLLAAFGLYCPGCGGTRAVHSLLHGDIASAFTYNFALMVLAPFLAIVIVRWARFSWKPEQYPFRLNPPTAFAWAIVVGVFTFTVARNIPISPFDFLAPHAA